MVKLTEMSASARGKNRRKGSAPGRRKGRGNSDDEWLARSKDLQPRCPGPVVAISPLKARVAAAAVSSSLSSTRGNQLPTPDGEQLATHESAAKVNSKPDHPSLEVVSWYSTPAY